MHPPGPPGLLSRTPPLGSQAPDSTDPPGMVIRPRDLLLGFFFVFLLFAGLAVLGKVEVAQSVTAAVSRRVPISTQMETTRAGDPVRLVLRTGFPSSYGPVRAVSVAPKLRRKL